MGNFSGGNRGGFGGGRSGGGRGGFGGRSGGRDGDRPSLHKAICSECGNDCEVPFRPTGDKPVYCNDCFGSKRAGEERGGRKEFGGGRPPRREYGERPSSRPSFDRPAPVSDDSKKLLMEIIAKLDRLTSTIEKVGQVKSEAKPAEKTVALPAMKPAIKEDKKKVVEKVVAKVADKKIVAKKVVAKKETTKKKK